MLIRWATESERNAYGFNKKTFGEYDVIVAINRLKNECLGISAFSREKKKIIKTIIIDENERNEIANKLETCAYRQIEPRGNSFHYKYPDYAEMSKKEYCPCCNSMPMPDGMVDIAEFEYSWVNAEPEAQGRLFGKCCVTSKYHSIYFYDMPKDIMTGFMYDVQRTAEVLHKITGAVKINYEIHSNTAPHIHCHLFPRYLDDDFPSAPIDYRITEPSPYECKDEFLWFAKAMQEALSKK